jgi:superfamily II DNA/RNA helicase
MTFEELNLKPEIMLGLKEMGFEKPTKIQERCIPEIIKGHNIVGQSLTGSGKTATFVIPILESIKVRKGIQALILTPTRELCNQVSKEIEKMGKFTDFNVCSIFGGVGYDRQLRELRNSEIVVATPGRLIDHINSNNINLNNVDFVVLDEADIMIDMGFARDVETILSNVKNKKQITMFSATMPPVAKKIIHKFIHNPVYITEQAHVDEKLLTQKAYFVNQEHKFSLLLNLLHNNKGSAIIFCRTKRDVDRILKNLDKHFKVAAIHGDIVQRKRQFAINDFKDNKIDFLIATDVAARGIDIKNVGTVYNFNIPKDATEYTHRIGRTARAGKEGAVINIISGRDEEKNYKNLIKEGHNITKEKLPDFEKIKFIKFDSRGRTLSRSDRRSGNRGERNRDRNKQNRNRKRKSDDDFKDDKYGKNRGRKPFGKRRDSRDSRSSKRFGNKRDDEGSKKPFNKKRDSRNNKSEEKSDKPSKSKKKFYDFKKKKKPSKKNSLSDFKKKVKDYKRKNN